MVSFIKYIWFLWHEVYEVVFGDFMTDEAPNITMIPTEDVFDYFYTDKEVRKMKLDKIENKR